MTAATTPLDATPRGPWRARLVPGVLVFLVLMFFTVPWWGRQLAFFRVHDVEVRGARYLKQSDVVARLGIDTLYSIWGSIDALEKRVERHPQVQTAHIRRSLPSKLVVDVTENEPIALVPARDGMRAYEEGGRALPIDPSRTFPDLPVVDRADTAVFRLLADLKAANREMYNRVSEIRRVENNELRILLLQVPVRAMRGVGAERFDELSSVQRDLAARGITPAELDLRFKDQVIARLP